MFTLNTARTYPYPVRVTTYDAEGREQSGKFTAVFKVVANSTLRDHADRNLLDLVLVEVRDLAITGPDGTAFEGEDLLDALKDDPAAAIALVDAYRESIQKKNRGRS